MVESITAALIAAAVLGMWFSATRSFGMAAVAVLAFLYPVVVTGIFIFAAVTFYLLKVRKP